MNTFRVCEELLISPPELCDWNWNPETPVWIRSETRRQQQWVKDLWGKTRLRKKRNLVPFFLTELLCILWKPVVLSQKSLIVVAPNRFNNLCWLPVFMSSHVLSTNVDLWEFVNWGGRMWVIDQLSWTVGLMLDIKSSSLDQEWNSSSTTVSQTVRKICADSTSNKCCVD